MDNMKIYEAGRSVPEYAKSTIKGGRLSGMTDIKPMWRIEKLTEMFGACGFGWYYTIEDKWVEVVDDKRTANVLIELHVCIEGEWSRPITGIGGSMLLDIQKGAPYVNDECYKMATTDAISVACKQLGIGADVYMGSDNTKYSDRKRDNVEQAQAKATATKISASHVQILRKKAEEFGIDIAGKFGKTAIEDLTEAEYGRAINQLASMRKGAE